MKELKLADIQERLTEMVPAFAARVAPLYLLTGWGWGSDKQIPRDKDIRDTLYGLIDRLQGTETSNATGKATPHTHGIPKKTETGKDINDSRTYRPRRPWSLWFQKNRATNAVRR